MTQLFQTLAAHQVALIAVSKTQPVEKLLRLYAQGQRVFAENRVQELLEKQAAMPPDVAWHLIGHLQTNKVKMIAPFVQLIHSVDSLKLLQEIDRQAFKCGRVIDCLLQFHVAQEETKFGLDTAEAVALLESDAYTQMQHIRLCGIMGMASFTENKEQVRREMRTLRHIFEELKHTYFPDAPHFKEISMGMSGDWEIAVEEGSTMVRIGSLLFSGE
jgi:pyridoxal phosphate enzyme (YggS family)